MRLGNHTSPWVCFQDLEVIHVASIDSVVKPQVMCEH